MHELDYGNDQGGTTDANRLSQTVSVIPPPVPATAREKGAKNKGLSQLSQLSHRNLYTFKDEEEFRQGRANAPPAVRAGTGETNAAIARVSR